MYTSMIMMACIAPNEQATHSGFQPQVETSIADAATECCEAEIRPEGDKALQLTFADRTDMALLRHQSLVDSSETQQKSERVRVSPHLGMSGRGPNVLTLGPTADLLSGSSTSLLSAGASAKEILLSAGTTAAPASSSSGGANRDASDARCTPSCGDDRRAVYLRISY